MTLLGVNESQIEKIDKCKDFPLKKHVFTVTCRFSSHAYVVKSLYHNKHLEKKNKINQDVASFNFHPAQMHSMHLGINF